MGTTTHVVDPHLDLRDRLQDKESLRQNLLSRGMENVDIDIVEKDYMEWWNAFRRFEKADEKDAARLKRELKEKCCGLLNALELPNVVGKETTSELEFAGMKNKTKTTAELEFPTFLTHISTLKMMGLCRTDSKHGLIHLVGYPATLLKAIQERITNKLTMTRPVSPPYMVRQAILEACNMNLHSFCSFTEGKEESKMYLPGVSLPTILANFVKTNFSENTNEWPICFMAQGTSYRQPIAMKGLNLFNSVQKEKIGIVVMGRSQEECDKEVKKIADVVLNELESYMGLELQKETVCVQRLEKFESQAVQYMNKELIPRNQIIRESKIGSYISKRLNMTYGDGNEFASHSYLEIDISSILGSILEKSYHLSQKQEEMPQIIKDLVEETSCSI
uniref:Separase n=1 Tax=Rhabditophanes sp. KR3021 TaxID=114890 RepID=A0AC35TGC3_9BILA